MELSPSTWRVLGLSVAVSYIGLGSFGLLAPVLAAKTFGLYPIPKEQQKEKDTLPSTTTTASSGDSESHAAASVSTTILLVGARDLSIGIALSTFWAQDNLRAMGTLILSGMVLCVVDVYEIWRLRGPGLGSAFGAGAAIWMVIGYGLVQ